MSYRHSFNIGFIMADYKLNKNYVNNNNNELRKWYVNIFSKKRSAILLLYIYIKKKHCRQSGRMCTKRVKDQKKPACSESLTEY